MTVPAQERSALLQHVLSLVIDASAAYQGTPQARILDEVMARIHEPLRVAIAGKVKAGKSTLLNALVGDEVAPTDAGECTRIVTWYRHGIASRVWLTPRGGIAGQIPFTRSGSGALQVQLGNWEANQIESLQVEWPVPPLATMTLIDTPGIGSLSSDVSASSMAFLAPDDEQTTPSDAVVYLLRHLHATDVSFLHAFHEEEYAQPSPVNCIAVLSRADEVSAGRIDAMTSASRIAARYATDHRLHRLVQTVVPVAGLLAQAGTNLQELEFRRLRMISAAEPDDREKLLLSADRFVIGDTTVPLAPNERRLLIERLGLFGIRLAVDLLGTGQAQTASQLANQLVGHSGITHLRDVLLSQFADRRDTLKARSALLAVQRLLQMAPVARSGELEARVEQIRSGAHEFAELRLLNSLRAGEVDFRPDEGREVERLLGGDGGSIRARLGLESQADEDEVRRALFVSLGRWRQRAENPVSSLATSAASRVLVRTCEGLYAGLVTVR
ncbi:MAG: dynamin family protein [Acidimicrobiales bacterium]